MIVLPQMRGFGKPAFVAGKVWTLLHTETYDYGGADGSSYTSGPATGWTNKGDWGYPGRIWTSGDTDRGIRFGKSTEVGGSQNSLFRNQNHLSTTYFTNQGITNELRIKWRVKFPTSGGFTRQDGGGYSAAFGALLTIANSASSQWKTVGIRNATTLGIWNNTTAGDAAIPAYAYAPTVSGSMGTITGGSWHTIDVRVRLNGSAGYIELWWDDVKLCEVTGNTSFTAGTANSVGGNGTYIMHPCGGTSSNTDLNYFGAADTIAVYK